jgi:hypothetical protein
MCGQRNTTPPPSHTSKQSTHILQRDSTKSKIHMLYPKLLEISSRPKPPLLRKPIAAKTSASDDISMNPDHLCSKQFRRNLNHVCLQLKPT